MYDTDKPFHLMDITRNAAIEQYKMFEQFRNEHNLKAIVIGGQAPTFDFIRDYIKIEMLIEDWRSEIMNIKFPFCHILALNEFYEILQKPTCLDTPRERIKFLGEVEMIYNMCNRRRDLFPDSAHPGDAPHTDLTKRLHDFIMENTR